jgi:hypothetical protein
MPFESGSGRGEPGLIGVAKPKGHGGTGRAVYRGVTGVGRRSLPPAGGGPRLHGDVFKWSKFGAAVAGRCAGCASGPARGS